MGTKLKLSGADMLMHALHDEGVELYLAIQAEQLCIYTMLYLDKTK